VLRDRSLWIMSAVYFCIMAAAAGLLFFTPTIMRDAGFGNVRQIGRAIAAVCVLGALGNVLISTIGGGASRRRACCIIASLITVSSLLTLVFVWHGHSRTATFIALVLGFAGTGASVSLFWQMSVDLLSEKKMVIGVPLISSIANLGSFFTPFLIGYLRDTTGTYAGGFVTTACVQGLGVVVLMFGLQATRRLSRTSEVSMRNAA
jgi:predicted MFS family arabinose efflux permease